MKRFACLGLPAQAEALPELITCGQPNPAQLQAAAQAGIRAVINLCPAGEIAWNEEKTVLGLGMRYIGIPVRGPADLTRAAARALRDALADASVYPAILHCGTANRAGALLAAMAYHCEGLALEECIALGRRAGLTVLEGALRECLNRAHVTCQEVHR